MKVNNSLARALEQQAVHIFFKVAKNKFKSEWVKGHVHKYEVVLWTLEKLGKKSLLQNDQFFNKAAEIFSKHVFYLY